MSLLAHNHKPKHKVHKYLWPSTFWSCNLLWTICFLHHSFIKKTLLWYWLALVPWLQDSCLDILHHRVWPQELQGEAPVGSCPKTWDLYMPNLLLAWHYLLCQWSESFPLRCNSPEVGLTDCDEEGRKKGIDAPFILSLHLPKHCKGNVTRKLLKGNFFWSHRYISVWHLLCEEWFIPSEGKAWVTAQQ